MAGIEIISEESLHDNVFKPTDNKKDDVPYITIFRCEIIDQCLGCHIKNSFFFPLGADSVT